MGWAQRGRKPRLWCAAALTALLFGAMTPTLAGAGRIGHLDPTGTLEICKSSNHGMAGRTFQFSVNGGTPIAITGGSCSGPIAMPPGIVSVHELPTPGLQVKGIQGNRIQTKDLATGTVTAKVKKNTTPADETLLTFINEDAPALGFKICKAAAPDSPSLVGQLFSFTENGGPVFSVAAGTVAAPVCGPIQHYDLGTVVNVDELPTPSTHVVGRSTSPTGAAATSTSPTEPSPRPSDPASPRSRTRTP